MNIRKGLLRLWIVASIVFVICVCAVSYQRIREEFRIAHTDYDAVAKEFGGSSLLPADCSKSRGTRGADYSETENLCWYKADDFRRLYPEYKDLDDMTLSQKLYAKARQPLKHPNPWKSVTTTGATALGAPLAILALGWSLVWAFSGFRST